MSTENANANPKPTPEQAYNVLVQVSRLPDLKLSLADHAAIQAALEVIRPFLVPVAQGD